MKKKSRTFRCPNAKPIVKVGKLGISIDQQMKGLYLNLAFGNGYGRQIVAS